MPIIHVSGKEDLPEFSQLTDVKLRRVREPQWGLYIAESLNVITRALKAGHQPVSFLTPPQWLNSLLELLNTAGVSPQDIPIYVADEQVLEHITGFRLHRSALAAMRRPELPTVGHVVSGAQRVAVLDGFVDHTNVGAAFRSAAALGVDAVLTTPTCADPLYRRAIRVSMGAVFHLPWTVLSPWPRGLKELTQAGFSTAALALSESATSLDEFLVPDRLALIFGTEGHGLTPSTLAHVDAVVRIPMHHGIDSLNVAAAAAVAFWATRPS
ncbi:MAG TPA: RNA methyltransferase [Beutenbergiaceae bacterium]|nr:RNA methyltransferase [Beutenbergiaceae bacterium]